MIATLVRPLDAAEEKLPGLVARLRLGEDKDRIRPYALVTLHRPANVDRLESLQALSEMLHKIGRELPVIFPVQPRTRVRIDRLHVTVSPAESVKLLEPLPHLEFLALQCHDMVVITDTEGIRKETTYLGVPYLTIRENSERPVTITNGTNILVGQNVDRLCTELQQIL